MKNFIVKAAERIGHLSRPTAAHAALIISEEYRLDLIQKRLVFVAYKKKNCKTGAFMCIAADDYRQAFGFAVQHNCQGYMRMIEGAIALTHVSPIELKLVVPATPQT